ncbi:two-component system, NtrC family, nitrogen regulation sensor histidine kinase NtrY [Maridesulfovibrio ferrireducens]|uniref:histidine kinase n=1 Tax=Maridesulfovibrio ferrireducens TaxID=246191 RepID=A0A1G9CIM8_9BACT|nr:ATP-binding protein [Maridesulfovibrio ferrireducens]SDK51334.1 two-component system, NtrC family, nitrogen regulation sensor histidine kinase NtrY [Maridesulfovibrio ferrireducens]
MTDKSIKVSVPDTKQRKKRQREYFLAFLCLLIFVALSFVQLKYIGVNSYLFVGLFNLNFILLLVVLFIVVRNGVKLLLERRRKVLGSKLRTRMVLSFMSLSLIPTLLMFFMAMQFVQVSVDYWFKNQVEDSMVQSLELGRAFYASAQEGLERRGNNILGAIKESRYAWGGKTMNLFLATKLGEYDLGLLGVIQPDGEKINWHSEGSWEKAWSEINAKVDWDNMREHPHFWSTIHPMPGNDMVIGVLPVDEARTGFLILGENIGQGLLFKLDKVVRGLDEYKQLKTLKYPLKMSLYLTLGVTTLLIILGSIWFGFRLSKELSAPIQALAAGSQRIARGDLSVRLEDNSDDELGFMVQSFNRMAEDLEESQKSLKTANERLAQQNQELERRGRYMEAVLNNITAGVISLDEQGKISTVNNAIEEMLGITARFVHGKDPLALLPEGDLASLISDARSHMASSPYSQWQRQLSLTVDGRHRKFLVNVVALKSTSGSNGIVAVFEDITELEKMQRIAAWREVARRIAHEIKNPLTPIKLSAQRLQRKFGPQIKDEVYRESTDLIISQVEHLQQMVQEFSAYAKLPEVKLTPGSITPLLEEVVSMYRNSHTDISWNLELLSEIPDLELDREALRRTLINLLTNATEALGDCENPAVNISAMHDSTLGWLRIEVQDNGPGLSSDERSRMFEPYFSSKKSGTGLGLTIVKSIITDHRGFIRVKPAEPHGTVFVIELPT